MESKKPITISADEYSAMVKIYWIAIVACILIPTIVFFLT